MKRHCSTIMILTGLSLFLAVSTVLAADPQAPSSGNPVAVTASPRVQASSPSHPAVGSLSGSPALSPQAAPGAGGTLRPAQVDDIRDIRGPLHIPDPLLWLYYAIGALLASAAAAVYWRWFSRRRTVRAKQAFEIAFEQLEQAKSLMKPELADAFSVAVSDAIRTYIEKRFELPVTRHTTEEFMVRIQAEPARGLAEYNDLLHDFLVHCDLAKFARFHLTVDQMKEMHESAWQFVDQTRPRPEEKAAQQASEAPDADPAVSTVSEAASRRSLPGFFQAIRQRLIFKRTTAAVDFGSGSAVAAGGR